jgi:hypothetical protein
MIEGKIITEFDAKFYEGKCFNVRQEDKEYYDLVGKIRLSNTKYPKDQVEKLNWLWKDINKYILGEIEISEISDLIQAIEDKELREIVVAILRKNKCTGVMNDYIEYNIKYINKMLGEENIIVKPRLIYDRIYGYYNLQYITKYSTIEDDIYLPKKDYYINKVKNEMLERINYKKINDTIYNIEQDIRGYFKNTNNFYSIYVYKNTDKNCLRANVRYNNNDVLDQEYNYYDGCDSTIINEIKELIVNYKNELDIIDITDILKLKEISNNVDKMLRFLYPVKHVYYTRLSSWHPRKNVSSHYYKVFKNECISEDKYNIEIYMLNKDINITITNDTININNNEKIFVNNKDYQYIQKEIMNFISDKIRKERYKL